MLQFFFYTIDLHNISFHLGSQVHQQEVQSRRARKTREKRPRGDTYYTTRSVSKSSPVVESSVKLSNVTKQLETRTSRYDSSIKRKPSSSSSPVQKKIAKPRTRKRTGRRKADVLLKIKSI